MARGRKSKPTGLKVLQGNPGRRKLNPNEPKPGKAKGNIPAEFKVERAVAGEDLKSFKPPGAAKEAGKEFKRLSAELERLGLLTMVDVGLLTAYCQAYGLHKEASAWVNKLGMVTKTKDGNLIQNPHLAIVNKQAAIMAKIGAEFGFSPSSRSRLDVKGGENQEDALTVLLNRRKNA